MDQGHRETEELLKELEKRLNVEYRQAQREIAEKLEDYLRRFELKDQKWQEWVANGKKTQDEYTQWRIGQIAIGQRWEEMRDSLAQDLMNVDQIAYSMTYGYLPEAYALNHDYQTFQIERDSGIDTSYTLYSRETAEKMFRDDPQMLPDPGKKVTRQIWEGKATRWNNRHIQSVMMQALLQGNNISDIATRLQNAVGDPNRKAAIRNARTMVTNAQNMGRQDAMKRAEDKGIKLMKKWEATLDMRTRHVHRLLDGQTVPVDEPFKSELGEIMYPGQTDAKPANVYNCRCTMIAVVSGWDDMIGSQRSLEKLEGMSYDQWKESKIEKPLGILRPDERQDENRAGYIREYRENPDAQVESGRDPTLDIDARHVLSTPDGGGKAVQYPDKGKRTARTEYKFVGESKALSKTMSSTQYNEYVDSLLDGPMYIVQATERWTEPTFENTKWSQDEDYMKGKFYYDTNKVKYYLEKASVGRFSTLNHERGHSLDYAIDGNTGLDYGQTELLEKIGGIRLPRCASISDRFMSAMQEDTAILRIACMNDSWIETIDKLCKNDMTKGTQDYITGIGRGGYIRGLDGKLTVGHVKWGHGDDYFDEYAKRAFKGKTDREILDRLKGTDLEGLDIDEVKTEYRNVMVAIELFANIQSALLEGGVAESTIRKFAPNSVDAYSEIVKEASEWTR